MKIFSVLSAIVLALPPDHTQNAEEVARFRDAAITIAERKMSESDAKRISTGGDFHGFFVWDSAFAVLWARHLDERRFPYHSTLDQFYPLAAEDGFIAREFTAEGKPVWSNEHPIAFAPPLLSWAEIVLFRDGKSDKARLQRVYPALRRHHAACAKRFRRADGLYFGDLFGCGMDDIPRWPRGMSVEERTQGGIPFTPESIAPESREKIWNWLKGNTARFCWNRQAGWIDLTAQMAFDCLNLAEMAEVLGLKDDADAYRREHDAIAAAVNAKCWDEERGFYFDVTERGITERYLAAAYWTLLAKIPSPRQAKRMVEKLFDSEYFGSPVMLASLARCDPDYNPEHGYWTGPVWPPTTYMTICGLNAYGFRREAEEVAKRWYNGLYEIFLKTGTLWENASPEQWQTQKGWAARDFCGWTALAAIALPAEFGWGKEMAIREPQDGAVVEILSKRQREYLAKPREERIKDFADAGRRALLAVDKNEPKPTLVSWTWERQGLAPIFSVTLTRNGVPVAFKTARENYTYFDNLEIGVAYELELVARIAGEVVATATSRFSTAPTPPRLLRVPGIPNVRDLGGRIGLWGRRIRQNLVLRTAGLNDNPVAVDFLTDAECRAEFDAGTLTNRPAWQAAHMAKIFRGEWPTNDVHRVPSATARGRERLSDEARRVLLEDFGVRTDLDLRSASETAGMCVSPLGDRVKWVNVPMVAYYELALPEAKQAVKKSFDVFLDEANYPILFHCIAGQDRTGTLAFLLEALLGVEDEELYRDWECSGFTNPNVWFRHEKLFNEIYTVLKAYPGETTREKVEAFLKACGLTEADLAKIRNILLEEK